MRILSGVVNGAFGRADAILPDYAEEMIRMRSPRPISRETWAALRTARCRLRRQVWMWWWVIAGRYIDAFYQ